MTAPATKRRTRKPAAAATQALVPAGPFVGFEDARSLMWRASVAYSPGAPVMEIDRAAFDVSLDRCRMDEHVALQANHAHLDEVHAAINRGRDVSDRYDGSAYERAYRGELGGRADAEPADARPFARAPLPPAAPPAADFAISLGQARKIAPQVEPHEPAEDEAEDRTEARRADKS